MNKFIVLIILFFPFFSNASSPEKPIIVINTSEGDITHVGTEAAIANANANARRHLTEEERIQEMVTFEVNNSFTQEDIQKGKGLISRTKVTVKDMKIKIRVTMNNRPLKKDYKVKVNTLQLAEHKCTAKQKTFSYKIKGCSGSSTLQDDGSSTIQDDKELGINEVILTKKNNWSSIFEIDSSVGVFGVKEDWVAKYETELSKLEIEPKAVSIEAIK
jgi:hypothetical protein